MSKPNPTGSVTLVGAGCGPDLITVAGLRALRAADVVVYDDLLDAGLLEDPALSRTEAIYVGKRKGCHSERQEDINALLVRLARDGKHVVRLKGGDSFVFGRGGEEVLALQEAGIPFELIPGVTSAVAVPEHLGIPVTHRGVARSFTVITGHTKDDDLCGEDFSALAKLNGTLVFLMGLSRLPQICNALLQNGKDPDTKVSVLSQGYSEHEARYDGTLATITESAKDAAAPAIIVVGDVSAFDLRSGTGTERKTISVIGTEGFCQRFRAACPSAKTYPLLSIRPTDVAPDLAGYAWLGFLSGNAIDRFFETAGDRRSLAGFRFAVVGPATKKVLKDYGFDADFTPSQFDRETLMKELGPTLGSERVLLLGAAEDADLLHRLNDSFDHLGLYRTVAENTAVSVDTDYMVFASSSGVRAFFDGGGQLNGATAVCIGNATETELRKQDIEGLIARPHTIDGILAAIEED